MGAPVPCRHTRHLVPSSAIPHGQLGPRGRRHAGELGAAASHHASVAPLLPPPPNPTSLTRTAGLPAVGVRRRVRPRQAHGAPQRHTGRPGGHRRAVLCHVIHPGLHRPDGHVPPWLHSRHSQHPARLLRLPGPAPGGLVQSQRVCGARSDARQRHLWRQPCTGAAPVAIPITSGGVASAGNATPNTSGCVASASGSPAPAPGPVGSRRPCHLACTSPTTPCQPCLAGPASPELQRSARQRQPRPIQPSDQLAATAQGVSGSRVSAYP